MKKSLTAILLAGAMVFSMSIGAGAEGGAGAGIHVYDESVFEFTFVSVFFYEGQVEGISGLACDDCPYTQYVDITQTTFTLPKIADICCENMSRNRDNFSGWFVGNNFQDMFQEGAVIRIADFYDEGNIPRIFISAAFGVGHLFEANAGIGTTDTTTTTTPADNTGTGNNADSEDGKGGADTGIGGAAVFGAIAIAATGAIIVSRKKSK
jgi:hypothetical protein